MQNWQDGKRERLGDAEIMYNLGVKRPQDVADVQKRIDSVAKRHALNQENIKEHVEAAATGSPGRRAPTASMN